MTIKPFSHTISKQGNWLILFVWLLTTAIYLKIFGVVTQLEAGKYIEEAERFIKNGAFSTPRYWFYSVTLFILIISMKFKIGMTGAFIIQAILNLCAYMLFYKALKQIFQKTTTAFFTIIYLLLFWAYQSWVVFLYTESAFFSLILILFAVLVLYPPTSPKNIIRLALVFILLLISRPLGILFAGSQYFYLLVIANRKWKWILGAGSILVIIFGYFVVNAVFGSLKDWTITQAFEQESIICDMPDSPPYAKLDLAGMGSPIYQLGYYLTHNFSHFIHFAGIKLQYFFLMTRQYYSTWHNHFLLLNLVPLYFFALIGVFVKSVKFSKGINIFLLSSILLFAITIVFQCDDYHNRFVLSIFPFFVILAAKSFERLCLFLFKNHEATTCIGVEETIIKAQ